MTTYTKEQLIEYATTHLNLEVRQFAAEALYQLGRLDGVNSIEAAILATPTAASIAPDSSREGM